MRVYGLGDPVLDIVARVDHEVLQRLGTEPGGCVPVSAEEMAALLALPEVHADMIRVPGGSAANVMKGLASLAQASSSNDKNDSGSGGTGSSAGADVAVLFVGMVGRDDMAEEYRRSIAAHGVRPLLLQCPAATPAATAAPAAAAGEGADGGSPAQTTAPTATCLCLVTPDGQRTMRTSLGAALELSRPEQLPQPLLGSQGPAAAAAAAETEGQQQGGVHQGQQQPQSGSSDGGGAIASDSWELLHCEGYSLYRPAVTAAAMRAARAAGARVSLDLASFEVVRNCWQRLDALLQERLIDLIFCNEQEAAALCEAASVPLPEGCGPEQGVAAAQAYLLSRGASTVVVSCGSKGCIVKSADGTEAHATAARVTVVDTVGAGDFFTAGFLFALLGGASLQACAMSGCAAGTAAVQVAGAELGPAVLQRLQSDIAGILGSDKAPAGSTQAANALSAATRAKEAVCA